MNINNEIVISEFRSKDNKEKILARLKYILAGKCSLGKLTCDFNGAINRFCTRMTQELSLSDPLPGMSIHSQVTTLNEQFVREYSKNIGLVEGPIAFVLNDGAPISGRCRSHLSPNEELRSWKADAARGIQLRGDPSGDIKQKVYPAYNYQKTMTGPPEAIPVEHFDGSGPDPAGITVCDQGGIGQNEYYDQLYNNAFRALNTQPVFGGGILGWETAESDARLLSRRIFRSNEEGVENGIPRYEQRLYKRQIDRNISEDLRSSEFDGILMGQDTSTLRCRLGELQRRKCSRRPY